MNLRTTVLRNILVTVSLATLTPGIWGSAAAKPGAEWVTLGTSGGPAVQKHRSQIANALVVDGAVYLFDVGNGVQRQMAFAGLTEGSIKAIFLSHHHLDHNADLGPVMVTHRTFFKGEVPVIGPLGTRHLVTGLADANAPTVLAGFPTAGPDRPPLISYFPVTEIPESLDEPQLMYQDERIKVWAIGVDHFQQKPSIALDHMPDAVAYRVEAGGRIFVFTGDSGPSKRLEELARGADVLITEIVDPGAIAKQLLANKNGPPAPVIEAIAEGMKVNHLTSGEIGRMAKAADVKSVVLTHFVPSPEDTRNPKIFTRDLRRQFKGKVTMARDLDRF